MKLAMLLLQLLVVLLAGALLASRWSDARLLAATLALLAPTLAVYAVGQWWLMRHANKRSPACHATPAQPTRRTENP